MHEPEQDRIARALISGAVGTIRFAYLFGSTAAGRGTADSDVDIAVDAGDPLTWETRTRVAEAVTAVTGREVDVIDLATADPVIRMQVLRHGRVLVDADRPARHRFEVRTLSEYLDLKLDRAPVERALRETGDAVV